MCGHKTEGKCSLVISQIRLISDVLAHASFTRHLTHHGGIELTNLLTIKTQRLVLAIVLSAAAAIPAACQTSTKPQALSAGDLIKAVVANELAEREQPKRWEYEVEKIENQQILTGEQIETKDGPLFRLTAIDHKPLSDAQRQQENARINALLLDPGAQSTVKKQYDADEQQLEKLMLLMPDAFLYDYDGVDGNLVRIKFRPNPDYNPPSYEARALHAMAGTILIDGKQKRVARVSGELIDRVSFGFGFFGHIDKGGTVEMAREQVGPSHWKTSLINIKMSGRIVFFKTIDKEKHEIRSQFREVSENLTLAQANLLLRNNL